jgi:hypothetical protein
MKQFFYEIVPAKSYYGRHATGRVLLCNGCVACHGSTYRVRKLLAEVLGTDSNATVGRGFSQVKALFKYWRRKRWGYRGRKT